MNGLKRVSRPAAAIGIAVSLAMASGVACASLTYGTTTFDGFNAAVDQTTHLAWVSPNIASGDTWSDLNTLCPGGTCTGALAGLTWASDTQVNQFFTDIGIPLNSFTQSYAGLFGANLLGGLINFLGPTQTINGLVLETGAITDYLGGITNNPEVYVPILNIYVPNTSYMQHAYAYILGVATPGLDSESAWTFGAGNGYAEDPATFGWFYFTPAASVPEPGSLGMLGLGLGLLGLGFAWDKRRRSDHTQDKAGASKRVSPA